jgi:hypothetical protein
VRKRRDSCPFTMAAVAQGGRAAVSNVAAAGLRWNVVLCTGQNECKVLRVNVRAASDERGANDSRVATMCRTELGRGEGE